MSILNSMSFMVPICVVQCLIIDIVRSNKRMNTFANLLDEDGSRSLFSEGESFDWIRNEKNFHGKKLYLIGTEMASIYEMDRRNGAVSGFNGNIWITLAEFLNFTIVYHQIDHKTKISLKNPENSLGLMKNLSVHEVILPSAIVDRDFHDSYDYTFTLYESGCKFVMKSAYHLTKTWMFDIYSRNYWFGVGSLYLIMCCLSILNHILRKEDLCHFDKRSIIDHFFSLVGVFCNQGGDFCMNHGNQRILTCCAHVFSWLLISCFSSQIYVVMTQISIVPPFKDLEGFFFDTDYILLLAHNSASLARLKERDEPIVKKILDSNRVKYVEDFISVWREACSTSYRSVGIQLETLNINDILNCGLELQQKTFFRSHIAAGVTKNCPKKDVINYGIIKLIEVGIINYLKARWLNHYRPRDEKRPYSPISSEQVYLPHMIYLFGFCSSIILLAAEQIYYHYASASSDNTINHR